MKKERLIESMKQSKRKVSRRMRKHDAQPSLRQKPYLDASWEDYCLYSLLDQLTAFGWKVAQSDLDYFD
jgi:hypothetical protein